MAHPPMLEPDSAKRVHSEETTASSAPEKIPVYASSQNQASGTGIGESEFAEVLTRFSAYSAGRISADVAKDLALEVVLNRIVEQACLVTGATGAAIALNRGQEMICRASSGANAPGLGTRLDTNVGLSGACFRSRQVERCDDAWNDHRADPELLRQLNVRSVVVYPLFRGQDLAGILEIFSPLPAAFGDSDLQALESLAKGIVNNVQAHLDWVNTSETATTSNIAVPLAEGGSDQASIEQGNTAAPESETRAENALKKTWDVLAERAANIGRTPVQRFDWFTAITATIIFLAALLMGAVISVRQGWFKIGGHRDVPRTTAQLPSSEATDTAKQTDVTNAPMPAAAENKPASRQSVTHRSSVNTDEGSLQVFENGKEIFHTSPSSSESGAETGAAAKLSTENTDAEIVQRVEPQYPPQALAQRVQGPVVLDVRIGRDGLVQQIKVLSGNPLLSDAAVAAVRQWQFKPYIVHGLTVETQSKITLKFALPSN